MYDIGRIEVIERIVIPSMDHAQAVPGRGRMLLHLVEEQLARQEVVVDLQRFEGLLQFPRQQRGGRSAAEEPSVPPAASCDASPGEVIGASHRAAAPLAPSVDRRMLMEQRIARIERLLTRRNAWNMLGRAGLARPCPP